MENKVVNENYYVVQGWMIKELGLKGNELPLYAIIYGFSQIEGQVFSGSLQYLADWTNGTKQGVLKSLQGLLNKGLIGKNEKFINGVKFCEYYSTKLNGVLNKVEWGIKQSLPNNIDNNIDNNIEKENILKEKSPKKKYGEYKHVLLTDNEYQNLVKDFGESKVQYAIKRVDEYIQTSGKKYKDHNLVIRKWGIDKEDYKHNNYTKEQLNSCITDLDTVEV